MGKTPGRTSTVERCIKHAGAGLAETLWPTRCALCDAPGATLCRRCALLLPYIDQNDACPTCGAPFGRIQCCDCAERALGGRLPLAHGIACRSTVALDERTGRLVTLFKDGGDRPLGDVLARLLARQIIPRNSHRDAPRFVTYIPATTNALRRRGFDHAELIAAGVARAIDAPLIPCFERPKSADQRKLSRDERESNVKGRFALLGRARAKLEIYGEAILIDDVMTTGATILAGADALMDGASGRTRISCLTFARA